MESFHLRLQGYPIHPLSRDEAPLPWGASEAVDVAPMTHFADGFAVAAAD